MKLLLHAGTHKTATTEFQETCSANQELLSKSGLLYPLNNLLPENPGISSLGKGSYKQHSFLQRLAVKNDKPSVFQFFKDSYHQARELNCPITLCSGEDLESALIDNSIVIFLEKEARRAGYDEIEWIFVKRKSSDYYSSLYSQLARQAVVCDPLTLLLSIEKHGYYCVTNAVGVFYYVFDIIERFEQFKACISGCARIVPFENFIENRKFAGSSLLAELIGQNAINSFNIVDSRNESLTDLEREARYLLAYCNISATSENYNQIKDKLDFFINRRVRVLESCLKRARQSLSKYD